MRKLMYLAGGVVLCIGAWLVSPLRSDAGTRGHTTCTESFLRWHTDVAPVDGGYVTVDFGRDGVDYTTTVWVSAGVVELGARYAGASVEIAWHGPAGEQLDVKGNGVEIPVAVCDPPPTTTTGTTLPAPVTTVVPVPTTQPVPVTSVSTDLATTAPVPVSTPPVPSSSVVQPPVTGRVVITGIIPETS
jgi:hypothetical protein